MFGDRRKNGVTTLKSACTMDHAFSTDCAFLNLTAASLRVRGSIGFGSRLNGATAQGRLLTAAEQRVATSDDAQSSIYRRASQPQT
jgi:hypothetical protein